MSERRIRRVHSNPAEPRDRFTLERLWQTRAGPWAMIVLNPVGFRHAYVRLPEGTSVEDARLIPVHGGQNFGGPYPAGQLENGDGVPDGDWIGWDFGHFQDLPEKDRWLHATGGVPWPVRGDATFHLWTTDEVAAECERTALLVKALVKYNEPAKERP